jgi:hypothetical protein
VLQARELLNYAEDPDVDLALALDDLEGAREQHEEAGKRRRRGGRAPTVRVRNTRMRQCGCASCTWAAYGRHSRRRKPLAGRVCCCLRRHDARRGCMVIRMAPCGDFEYASDVTQRAESLIRQRTGLLHRAELVQESSTFRDQERGETAFLRSFDQGRQVPASLRDSSMRTRRPVFPTPRRPRRSALFA